jgi:thioredoxin reductase
VLVCDSGGQRNIRARAIHGYLGRDGTAPHEFLCLARAELRRYDTVECRDLEVVDARREGDRFLVRTADGARLAGRRLLLATGVVDELPDLDGLPDLYGISVHHCPYCDAWEWRDQPLAVYGPPEQGTALALALTAWSSDVLLCSGGRPVPRDAFAGLSSAGVVVREEPVLRLEGRHGFLERIVFAAGEAAARKALFLCNSQRQRSSLPERLGCRFNDKGAVDTGKCEATNVPGVYVAGDASREAQFVIVASAEGAEAGIAIHKSLMVEEGRSR